MNLELVELVGVKQRLRGAGAVHHHCPIAGSSSGVCCSHCDVGVELRATGWYVVLVDVMGNALAALP